MRRFSKMLTLFKDRESSLYLPRLEMLLNTSKQKSLLKLLMLCAVCSIPSLAQSKEHNRDQVEGSGSWKSSSCGHDIFEPNNYRSRARNLSVELKDTREINAKVCAGDHDWYTVWINRGEIVEFVLSSPLESPPLISVFAPRKRKSSGILRTSAPSTRRLRVYAKKSGRYRLHIRPKREASARYTLSLHRPSHE